MSVENKLQSFKNLHKWMKAVRLSNLLIYVLIYDERGAFSISNQDLLNLLNNLDCLDFHIDMIIFFEKHNVSETMNLPEILAILIIRTR